MFYTSIPLKFRDLIVIWYIRTVLSILLTAPIAFPQHPPDGSVDGRNSQGRKSPHAMENGGGVTVEIAVHPEGASVDNFDWRISMATVASDGPFLRLSRHRPHIVGASETVPARCRRTAEQFLTCESVPLFFAVSVLNPAHLLIGSAITDLNVMTWRGRLCSIWSGACPSTAPRSPRPMAIWFFFRAEGQTDLTLAAKTTKLERMISMVATNCDALLLELKGKGAAYLIL